jgi:hypothetical protein
MVVMKPGLSFLLLILFGIVGQRYFTDGTICRPDKSHLKRLVIKRYNSTNEMLA